MPLLAVLLTLWLPPASTRLAAQQEQELDLGGRTLVAMPLVNTNPAMKTSFGGIGMLLFRPGTRDTVSPPSVIGAAGLYSTNNSYVFAAPVRLFLREDRLRLLAFGGTARVNNDFTYDLDSTTLQLVYSEGRTFFGAEAQVRIVGQLYGGLAYNGIWTTYRFTRGTDEQNDFTRTLFELLGIEDNYVSSLGLPISYDTRDYQYYPTGGLSVDLRPKLFATFLGGDNQYVDIDYDARYYLGLTPNHVLVFRVSGGSAFGDVPFGGYQVYGGRGTLRGYAMGKYRGKHLIAGQAEFRWTFYRRFGAVAFGGVGTVWGGESQGEEDVFERGLLPSAGVGIRYMLSRGKRINARIDYALGVNGNDGLYLGIMEAF
jgi:outer membrane protein assembly factor BamA